MSTITYLDGTSLTSTALTNSQIETAFQIVTAQMLGIVIFQVSVTYTLNSNIATPAYMGNLAIGQSVTSASIPTGTTITAIGSTTITISSPATANSTETSTIAAPNAYSQVRIGWQQEGQPGPSIDIDTCFLRCAPHDTEYGRMRDKVPSTSGNTITYTDVYTRAWKTYWTFYGDNSLDRARALISALITIQFVANFLSEYNLYVNPDIKQEQRLPENFQGRWWERVDVEVMFNEQVTETYTVGTAGSVEVKVYDKNGLENDFTVNLP